MSKIISDEDDRYNLLPNLFDTYSYDSIIKYFDGYQLPWYFIVPYLVNEEYHTNSIDVYNSSTVIDENYDNWVSANSLGRVLSKSLKLTVQEYFDLTVLHINETDDRPKCSQCGRYLNWSGRFTAGYGSGGHTWNESNFHFCSQECSLTFRSTNPDKYEFYNKFLKSGGGFGMIHSDPDYYGIVGFGNIQTRFKTNRSKFINQGNINDTCYLYIVNSNGKLKYGITSDIESRRVFGKCFNGYSEMHIILESNRLRIANIEYYIKSKLNLPTEYIDFDMYDTFKRYFIEALIQY